MELESEIKGNMEDLQITQVDGEPPIYREMKPVPVTLESCILNSEEDYPYSQTEPPLLANSNCDDGELSAEEISSMIMINEGPNALSSVQEELESSKLNSSIRSSSDIKRILTSDLPKSGRFLSTKSLQKLTGAKKVKKNSKYTNEDETDVDDSSEPKVKSLTKQNKAVKENLNKGNQQKTLEPKKIKKDVKLEKVKVKSIKKANSLEKLATKKKLKTLKKTGLNKSKDLNSAGKVFKKKVLENNSVVKKKEVIPKVEGPESGVENKIKKSSKEKSDTENKPKLLISRSGRIRKVKDVSDFVLSKNKEAKIVNPTVLEQEPPKAVEESEKKVEAVRRLSTGEENSNGKENKSQGDLLQNALSESVESWFDISSKVENKGKRTRGKVKIIPKDSDAFFEETENSIPDSSSVETSDIVRSDSMESECPVNEHVDKMGNVEKEQEEEKEEKEEKAEKEKDQPEDDTREMENINETPADDDTTAENSKSDNTESNETNKDEKKDEEKKSAAKKNKPANRQLIGYKKKKRKSRNVTVSSYLKNYGERIDFNAKMDLEGGGGEGTNQDSPQNNATEETKSLKKDEVKDGNGNNLRKNGKDLEKKTKSEVTPTEVDKPIQRKTSGRHKFSPIKRSQSAESLLTSPESKIESPRKSAEMPASLPSREKEVGLQEKDYYPSSRKKAEDFKNGRAAGSVNRKAQTRERRGSVKKNPKNDDDNVVKKEVKETVSNSEEQKVKNGETAESKLEEVKMDSGFKIQKEIPKKRRRNVYTTKVFGIKSRRQQLWALGRKEKLGLKKPGRRGRKKKSELEAKIVEDSKPAEGTVQPQETKEPVKLPESSYENPTIKASETFSGNPVLSVPLKKRPRRTKTIESLEEAGKENKEDINGSDKQDGERRKSHREIKLTPKIVDMIATAYSYKRPRKVSSCKEESLAVKEDTEVSNSGQKPSCGSEGATPGKESSSEQPLAAVPSVENYLQSKMEANASNFESSWEPGDLVWARFAGNPFWPALILRDPFSNDEFSRVKYLGRLPRPFVHVQFLADFGRRAWGPELYIMTFNGLKEFEKLKSSLPEVNAFTQRKDLIYQQAFFTPKKMEKNWMDAIKEGETLLAKSKDERITYMKIKYPLVKYAASVANGRLVPNERTKGGDSPQLKTRKRRSAVNVSATEEASSEWPEKESDDALSKETFECVNTSDLDEGAKKSQKESPKITLKLVRSPKKSSKRKSSKSIDEADESLKKMKKRIKKEVPDDDYAPSDSGSNGEKGSETAASNRKKYYLFKGAKTEKVCQICFEILENGKAVKCKGSCQGLFHKSCADKMSADLPPPEEGSNAGTKNKRRKKLFADKETEESTTESKEPAEKEWRCNDCLRGENPCFVCNSRSGNRQRCCVAHCGKFYHQKCLKLFPQTVYNQGAPIKKSQALQQNKTKESESPHYQILSCPLHVCHTCASDNPADFNMKYLCEKLVKCIKCPSAYHGGNFCVPAGSTILNTSQIICAKHGDPGKKSHVNISWCFICNMGGSLICCEWCPSSFHLDCLNIKPPDGPYICEECESGRFPLYGEVVWVKLGRYRWWPARVLFPQEILPNIMALPHKSWEFAVRFYGSNDHYWLNRGRVFLYQEGDSEQKFKGQSHVDKIYQRAVREATKDYFAIQEERKSRLLGTNNSGVMKPPPYVRIKTNKAVGKVQLGNVSQSEPQTCDCDPNSEAPCSPGSDCLNRMLLVECDPNYCNAGSRCANQSFEKRMYPPLEPYRTERRGWGLRSSEDIPKGAFVIEYVGEVVDDEEFKRRMKRKQDAKDNNYYFLTIDKDRMIDAGPKGNLARFMNHSCSPNCETQKWTVNGDTRVGLFALRDIPAGTELTFNYNLDCIGNEKKACHCEEENCSGFIGVKAKIDKDNLKNKLVKRLDKESEDECFVCSDGGELMVCDLPNCPKVYHLECVNLTEWPNELWFCPRHQCNVCGRTTKRCCKLCTNAYCYAHLDNNMFPDNLGGLLCSKHSTCAVKPAQILRKASYVNRNTPVVEYEKPFAEKYRPPPQKERASPEEKTEDILMEPNLTDNTPIVVENPLLSSSATPTRLSDGVSVQVLYVDEEGQIVRVDGSALPDAETVARFTEEVPKPVKRKKRTNIPRKKLNPPVVTEETENKQKSQDQGGINFESLMIKSVEDKILDSKLNLDNIYNIIGGGGGGGGGGDGEVETGQSETDGAERCLRDDGNDLKTDAVNKKEEAEVDRSRRSKYFKIITPEKFIKVSESESNQKKVTDFNYIEFMHPLRSARSKTKTDENTPK